MRLFPIVLFGLICACSSVKPPSERYVQYEYGKTVRFENNELKIELTNPLYCHLRVWVFDSVKTLQPLLDKINPILLEARKDTILRFPGLHNFENSLTFSSRLGDPEKPVEEIKVELPFPKGRTYRIIQGNDTQYTHNTDWSRYAVDFDLKINDTICAATDGYVVGVVDRYQHGGPGEEWEPFGNFITIYDPDSGLFTQYVHLVQDGSLVKPGSRVKRGQPIALSGKTGQTDVEHLHFNVLVPVHSENGLESIPVEYFEGYRSVDLKKNDIVKKRENLNPDRL